MSSFKVNKKNSICWLFWTGTSKKSCSGTLEGPRQFLKAIAAWMLSGDKQGVPCLLFNLFSSDAVTLRALGIPKNIWGGELVIDSCSRLQGLGIERTEQCLCQRSVLSAVMVWARVPAVLQHTAASCSTTASSHPHIPWVRATSPWTHHSQGHPSADQSLSSSAKVCLMGLHLVHSGKPRSQAGAVPCPTTPEPPACSFLPWSGKKLAIPSCWSLLTPASRVKCEPHTTQTPCLSSQEAEEIPIHYRATCGAIIADTPAAATTPTGPLQ